MRSYQSTILYFLVLLVPVICYHKCKKIETLNAGLVFTVPKAEERTPRIVEALLNSTADVLCVQEIWYEKDLYEIIHGLRHVFPHHFSDLHYKNDVLRNENCYDDTMRRLDTACSDEERDIFLEVYYKCGVTSGCFKYTGTERELCMFSLCQSVLSTPTIRPECITCVLFDSFRVGDLENALVGCSVPIDNDNRINHPGLLLLSREKLFKVSYTSFFPLNRTVVDRGYVKAKLKDGKEIVCTHLSAKLPLYFEFDLSFDNYEDQSRAEVVSLVSTFKNKDHILVGDINMGPRVTGQIDPEKNLEGIFLDNYELLMNSMGYVSPFLMQDGRCTFCKDNPLALDEPNDLIDVILVVNGSSYVTPQVHRLYDSYAEWISDHFGVQVQVCEEI